ncbi:PA2779 family protein [Flagellatimonas centrodinii]|uniref:PA2779 family protein n=1 Tax=Flagellatimonas centrodinii TaxID=2806210 RepID=UPI001FED9A4C|nr:PA2779 family protein [Flagellatimonas centrodinii]ULQ45739.1 PA2779 family protein [Flagellatimonas centrodinii]
MQILFRQSLAAVMAFSLLVVGLLQPAHAAMMATDALVQESRNELTRSALQAQLDASDVQARLADWGVSPEQARTRVAHLTDAELQQLAAEMETLPAGAGIAAALGIVFVVLLVLELVGIINIFNAI